MDKTNNLSNLKFSEGVKYIITLSREIALRIGNDFIDEGHLILAIINLIQQPRKDNADLSSSMVLKELGLDLSRIAGSIEFTLGRLKSKTDPNKKNLPLTKMAERMLKLSYLLAKETDTGEINSAVLLLSIVKNKKESSTIFNLKIDYDEAMKIYSAIVPKINASLPKVESGLSNHISLFFDLKEYSPKEIAAIIAALSELYHNLSDDELEIKGIQNIEYHSTLIPA